MRAQIVTARIDLIDSNPHRHLAKYPYVPEKIAALKRSIKDVGLWEGIIGRKVGRRYQIAFGHHRLEAARRSKLAKVDLIVRNLDDEEMLQFMGRENLEDYNADFLCMLETWEAAREYEVERVGAQDVKNLDIARLLGWTRTQARPGEVRPNNTAEGCINASELIEGGYLKRKDLQGLNVTACREVCGRARTHMKQLEKTGRDFKRPKKDIEIAKRHVAKGAKATLKEARTGTVSRRDMRGRVDVHAYRSAGKDKRVTPLFSSFGQALGNTIARMLDGDASQEKLAQIRKAVGSIDLKQDEDVVNRLKYELKQLEERAATERRQLLAAQKKRTSKVVHLPTRTRARA